MRITKTSAQAEADEQLRQAALQQTEECPECGIHRTEIYKRDFGTCEEVMIMFRPVVTSEGTVYRCKCLNCGCEWDTSTWGDRLKDHTTDEEERDYAEAGRILLGEE